MQLNFKRHAAFAQWHQTVLRWHQLQAVCLHAQGEPQRNPPWNWHRIQAEVNGASQPLLKDRIIQITWPQHCHLALPPPAVYPRWPASQPTPTPTPLYTPIITVLSFELNLNSQDTRSEAAEATQWPLLATLLLHQKYSGDWRFGQLRETMNTFKGAEHTIMASCFGCHFTSCFPLCQSQPVGFWIFFHLSSASFCTLKPFFTWGAQTFYLHCIDMLNYK